MIAFFVLVDQNEKKKELGKHTVAKQKVGRKQKTNFKITNYDQNNQDKDLLWWEDGIAVCKCMHEKRCRLV